MPSCDTCGAFLSDHQCRLTPVSGHCQHYVDLTPEQCGHCATDRQIAAMKAQLDEAALLIADGGRYPHARASGHDDRAVRWLDRNGYDMVTGRAGRSSKRPCPKCGGHGEYRWKDCGSTDAPRLRQCDRCKGDGTIVADDESAASLLTGVSAKLADKIEGLTDPAACPMCRSTEHGCDVFVGRGARMVTCRAPQHPEVDRG